MTKKIMNQFCSQRQLATEYKRLFGIKPFAIADASRFFHLILWLSLSGSVKELSSVYRAWGAVLITQIPGKQNQYLTFKVHVYVFSSTCFYLSTENQNVTFILLIHIFLILLSMSYCSVYYKYFFPCNKIIFFFS